MRGGGWGGGGGGVVGGARICGGGGGCYFCGVRFLLVESGGFATAASYGVCFGSNFVFGGGGVSDTAAWA